MAPFQLKSAFFSEIDAQTYEYSIGLTLGVCRYHTIVDTLDLAMAQG
jgi:hypothetical protein